jgi:predicted Zn finger-like uncharacterized protein
MQAICEHCGARYILKDQDVAGFARVQFRCSKCGYNTVVEVACRSDMTMVVSPLPEFARAGGAGPSAALPGQFDGLVLPTTAQVVLTVLTGPAKGLIHRLVKPRVILGRAGADVDLQDPEVSRQHCAIEVKGPVIRLKDLDSTNGTYLEVERVRAAELQSGTEFRIGSSVIRVSLEPR